MVYRSVVGWWFTLCMSPTRNSVCNRQQALSAIGKKDFVYLSILNVYYVENLGIATVNSGVTSKFLVPFRKRNRSRSGCWES
ncbi:hypothetical protein LZ31DRAFT_364522 [Colletotrichum somersetense]|nr:hypothetical protein LZ31DRAFT_364522 [Colletotrichum somersetense]